MNGGSLLMNLGSMLVGLFAAGVFVSLDLGISMVAYWNEVFGVLKVSVIFWLASLHPHRH